jgi:hypothetical protein
MRWTAEDEAKLREMWATGASFCAIGAELNRSGDAVFQKGKTLGLGSKPCADQRSPVWAFIVRVCADGRARSVHELIEVTGAARVTIDHLMRRRSAAGQAHVARWEKRWGAPTPYWLPVPGKNAPKPRVKTHSERQRDRMRRLKEEDPLQYKAIVDRKTVRRALSRGTVRQQHEVVRAMFGMGAPA